MSRIFLSHATEERDLVVHLANYLEKNNLEAWYAPRNIMGGIDYDKEIIAAIKECSAFVLILSHNSDASEDVKTEVYHAVKFKKVVICLDVEDIEPENLSYLLGMRHRLNWLEHRDETLDRLAHDIKMLSEPASFKTAKPIIETKPAIEVKTKVETQAVIKIPASKPEGKREPKIGNLKKFLTGAATVIAVSCTILFIYAYADKSVNDKSVEIKETNKAETNLVISSDTLISSDDNTFATSALENALTPKRQKKTATTKNHTKTVTGKGIVVNVPENDWLNIRARPTIRSSILAKLNNGDIIKINSRYKKPNTGTIWYNVTDEKTNITGFVSSKYIRKLK